MEDAKQKTKTLFQSEGETVCLFSYYEEFLKILFLTFSTFISLCLLEIPFSRICEKNTWAMLFEEQVGTFYQNSALIFPVVHASKSSLRDWFLLPVWSITQSYEMKILWGNVIWQANTQQDIRHDRVLNEQWMLSVGLVG